MTRKFVGSFSFDGASVQKHEAEGALPDKQRWHEFEIWEFNGKRYRPVSEKAAAGLEALVKELEAAGFKGASKVSKRKLSSLKYAICTLGVEDFELVK